MSNKVWKRFNRANVPSCHLLFHAATQARSDTATFVFINTEKVSGIMVSFRLSIDLAISA